LADPVDDERRRLVASQRQHPNAPKDFIINPSELYSASFLVLGDTGEGDESQFGLVPSLWYSSLTEPFSGELPLRSS
jgi:hypothetical protein